MTSSSPLFDSFPGAIMVPASAQSLGLETVRALLREHPVVLFRGADGGDFSSFVHGICEPLAYTYRSTPRTELQGRVYTATEYPKELCIPQHCENAYQSAWPMRLFFQCVIPAAAGGCTPLTDMRAVTAHLDRDVVAKFLQLGVRYVRNYGTGIDFSWQDAFQTDSRPVVEAFCRERGIAHFWLPGGLLRTVQVLPAMAAHPVSGEQLWFNQAHLFHVSSLDAETQEDLLGIFAPQDLPRNAYYGDGSDIEEEVLDHIREVHSRLTQAFSWQAGDVLAVDNMYVAHGRQPFSGERKVLVMMGDGHHGHKAQLQAV